MVAMMLLMTTLAQRIPTTSLSDGANVQQVSLGNPYVMAVKLAYNLKGSGLINDNILFSAGGQIDLLKTEKFSFPIVGVAGLGIKDLLNASSGLNIGAYPYYSVYSSSESKVILHSGFVYKLITKDVVSGAPPPQQVRTFGGVELIYQGGSNSPITLSLTSGYMYNTIGTSTGFFEGTVILPVMSRLALLIESTIPFKEGKSDTRIAILTTL